MSIYQERVEAKRERLAERAAATREAAEAASGRARQMYDAIPFGQPILVGHHSEGRDRRYRDQAWNLIGKSVKLDREADRLEERAEGYGTHGISSDDPDAPDAIKAKIATLEALQATMKRRNALIRKHAKAGVDAQIAALVEDGMNAVRARGLIDPDFCGRQGFPDYALSNNNANIRRYRQRLETLEARTAAPAVEGGEVDGISWGEDTDLNRIWLAFPGKPAVEVRARLKGAGFRWAPSLNRWQRQTSPTAVHQAKAIFGELTA